MKLPRRRLAALLLPLLVPTPGCGDPGEVAPDPADVLARERAAALFSETEFERALQQLSELADREAPALEDLLGAANTALQPSIIEEHQDRARAWLERAAERDPDDPRVLWSRAHLARIDLDWETSLELLLRVEEQLPDDLPTLYVISSLLEILDRPDEAEGYLRRVQEVGLDYGGSWYTSGLYRLSRLLYVYGEDSDLPEIEALEQEYVRLTGQGIKTVSPQDQDRGNLGVIVPPAPHLRPDASEEAAKLAPWILAQAGVQEAPGVIGLLGIHGGATITLEEDKVGRSHSLGNVHRVRAENRAPQGLLTWGSEGLALGRWVEDRWVFETLVADPVTSAAAFDLGVTRDESGDGDLDLVYADGSGIWMLVNNAGVFEPAAEPILAVEGVRDLCPTDFDNEGDLDLLVATDGGPRLLRNDGAHTAEGGFTDVAAEAGLPAGRAFAWCAVEDYDGDNDVDLFLGGPDGAFLASNDRGGSFSDASAILPAGLEVPPCLADFDHDGLVDLWTQGAGGRFFRGTLSKTYEEAEAPDLSRPLVGDLLLAGRDTVVVDVDQDGAPELVERVELEGAPHLRTTPCAQEGRPASVTIYLRGIKNSSRGRDAIVELVFGPVYRRIYTRGEPLVLGTHGFDTLDVIRITWPNGVVQNVVDLPGEGAFQIRQREGLEGSCPFLYTWNGETYVFVSDVIGITPLGLPMGPGLLVPPDHDEYVLIRGDQLVPKDGVFELQFTEELREVTYLDRLRLDVVDHPLGAEIFPNERFTFPPFPEPHIHSIERPLAPLRALGSDGVDWTASLSAVDGDHASPFEPLRGQFQGLASPHFLELEFDPRRVAGAPKLRLAMTGWLYWTDASVNMAAARTPGVDFVPPLLQVPDPAAEGGWRTVEPPLGFPAGKTKTMVVDVTEHVDPADPRLRIFSTLRLYWDAILLAVDGDDAARVITPVEPSSAELWRRGFSKSVPYCDQEYLEWFEWDELEPVPRWNMHPGNYTKLGPCLPLVTAVDDIFVVMGAGDALTVRFPADGLPEIPEGWTRDYLLYIDGWAKDRDPNTREALHVEPLPFHGMSGYPYGPDESFPDTEAHRAWRREWQTRPAQAWIEALAPALHR